MSDTPSLKDVLGNLIADGCLNDDSVHARWSKELFGFLKRWHQKTDSSLWEGIEGIAAGAEKKGMSRTECFVAIIIAAGAALARGGRAKHLSRTTLQKWSNDCSALADSAQLLADHYREQIKGSSQDETLAQWFEETAVNSDQQSETLAEWYEEEARRFRNASANFLAQSRSYDGPTFSQEQRSFMRSLAFSMRRNFGQPHDEVVAAITNIAYPSIQNRKRKRRRAVVDVDNQRVMVDFDDVHQACKGQLSRSDAAFLQARMPDPGTRARFSYSGTRRADIGIRVMVTEGTLSTNEGRTAFIKDALRPHSALTATLLLSGPAVVSGPLPKGAKTIFPTEEK
jgi:hypothetical protein